MMLRHKNLVLWLAIAAGTGCAGRRAGNGVRDLAAGEELITTATTTSIGAGESTQVECLILDASGTKVPDFEVTLIATPRPQTFVQTGNKAEFSTIVAGLYNVRCESIDGQHQDSKGVDVQVQPLAVARWDIDMPDGDCVSANDVFDPNPRIYDVFGNQIDEEIEVSTQVIPAAGWDGDARSGLRFREDGFYNIVFEVRAPATAVTSLKPISLDVEVDATVPFLHLDIERSGSMLQSTPGAIVPVTGYASDTGTGIETISVNGVPVIGKNNFTRDQTLEWGLNLTVVEAVDRCGNVTRDVQPFFVSQNYLPALTNASTAGQVQAGVVAQLNQDFIDDGDRSDEDDVATLAQNALREYPFEDMAAPNEVLSSRPYVECGPTEYTLRRSPSGSKKIRLDNINIDEMGFVGRAFEVDFDIVEFDFPFKLNARQDQCVNVFGNEVLAQSHFVETEGWIGFDRIGLSATVEMNLAAGQTGASVYDADFQLQGFYIQLDCGVFQDICDELTGNVSAAVEALAEDVVVEALQDEVGPLLGDMLEDFGFEASFSLPEEVGGGALALNTDLSRLSFCGPNQGLGIPAACHAQNTNPGAVSLALATQVVPGQRGASIDPGARGPMLRGAAEPSISSQGNTASIAIGEDMLNQALWAAWYRGAMHFEDAATLISDEDQAFNAEIDFKLPPNVKMNASKNSLALGLGGMRIRGEADITKLLGFGSTPYPVGFDVEISGYSSAGLDLAVEGQNLVVTVSPDVSLEFQFHELADLAYGDILASKLSDELADAVPKLIGDLVVEVELPVLDVGNIGGLNSDIRWGVTDAGFDVVPGYAIIQGSVGRVP